MPGPVKRISKTRPKTDKHFSTGPFPGVAPLDPVAAAATSTARSLVGTSESHCPHHAPHVKTSFSEYMISYGVVSISSSPTCSVLVYCVE